MSDFTEGGVGKIDHFSTVFGHSEMAKLLFVTGFNGEGEGIPLL